MARSDREVDASLTVTAAQKAAADAALDVAEKAKIAAMRQANAAPAPEVKAVGANTAALQVKQAAATAARATAEAANPLLNKAVMPTDAPAGQHYTWIGGTTTGSWKLYNDVVIPDFSAILAGLGGNGGNGGGGGGGGGGGAGAGGSGSVTAVPDPQGPSTNITVLKSLLYGLGYSKTLVDSSTQYFMSLIAEGLDYDNIVSLYTDAKDYTLKSGTKITSPFYEQYGYLNEGLTQPKSAADLFHFVEGAKNLIKSYNISSKFAEPDALKKYIANNVTVAKLDERIMAAKLKTITADPQYVNTLRELKYINSSEDLTDFFLDPKIGEAQLEINRKTASFATEAMRRSNAQTGISFNADSLTRNAATLIGQGRSEAQIADIANQGYETIANTLQPEVGLSNIFEGTNAANAQTIQTELESEQFLGLESSRRKKLKELGTNIFNQSAGQFQGRITSYSNSSPAGQI